MQDHRFAQRMFTLLSLDAGAGIGLCRQTYETHRAEGGPEEPMLEQLFEAAPGTPTFVKLQRVLMADMRQRMR